MAAGGTAPATTAAAPAAAGVPAAGVPTAVAAPTAGAPIAAPAEAAPAVVVPLPPQRVPPPPPPGCGSLLRRRGRAVAPAARAAAGPLRQLWNQRLAPVRAAHRVPNGCLMSWLAGVPPDAPHAPPVPGWVTAYLSAHLRFAPACLVVSLLCLAGVTPPWTALFLLAVVPGLLLRAALCNFAIARLVAHTFEFYFLMGNDLLAFVTWGDMLRWDVRAVIPAVMCLVFYPNALMTDAVTSPQLGRSPAMYVISVGYFMAVFALLYSGSAADIRERSVSLVDDHIRFFVPEFFLGRLGTQIVFLWKVVGKLVLTPHETIGIAQPMLFAADDGGGDGGGVEAGRGPVAAAAEGNVVEGAAEGGGAEAANP